MGSESTKKKQDTCSALEHSMVSSLLPYKFQRKTVGGTTKFINYDWYPDSNTYQATEILK